MPGASSIKNYVSLLSVLWCVRASSSVRTTLRSRVSLLNRDPRAISVFPESTTLLQEKLARDCRVLCSLVVTTPMAEAATCLGF
ncbi:hypothetical protein L484_021957 [Morus notabilis]|uniref:Secreted protein n=1 Tax=Morus notabilis TaxID=981085 RepID=W9QMC1_9ROSA|nr:hypothetical protein L484_021957 [Morus notabilis]